MVTFEQGFAETERSATAAVKAAQALVKAAKALQKAAQDGDILKIRRASERLSEAREAAGQEMASATAAWPFSPEAEESYLHDGYEAELMAAAQALGLRIHRQDLRLVAFPSVIRVLPADRAVRVDLKKVPAIRPSRLAARLQKNQSTKPRFSSQRFLEALYGAYRRLVGKEFLGTPLKLADIYEMFTSLPGARSEYDRTDFSRDLYLLDRSGLTQTRTGATISFSASTGTRQSRGTYSFIGPDGETVTYFAIRFSERR